MQYLPHFPIKSQLTSPTMDGQPNENKWYACVETVLASMFQYLTGRQYEPDEIKDAVRGQGYVGFDAAALYVTYAAKQGVHLFAVDNMDKTNLVWSIRQHLEAGRPCIATEPDPYAPPAKDWSHVIVFHGFDASQLVAMDPWTAADITRPDSAWAALLQFNEIWVGEPMNITSIPAGWIPTDGSTLTAPNGISVKAGFREYILNPANKWQADNWPLAPEAGRTPLEESNPGLGGGTWQPFRKGVLEWTPTRGVFPMWTGQELFFVRQRESAAPGIDMPEIMAGLRMIEETAQHLMDTVQHAQPVPAPVETPATGA